MNLSYKNCISWQEYQDIVYVFNEKSGRIYLLQDVSKDFWISIPEFHSLDLIAADICMKYTCINAYDMVYQDLKALSFELQKYGILDIKERAEIG